MDADRETTKAFYAVIEAMRSEALPERFVIAYRNERSLRQVIADLCIVSSGFASREEAWEVSARP